MVRPTTPQRISERDAIAATIKAARKRADLTQEQAAERIGVAVQSWRRYEWGERDLPLQKLARIAEALGSDLKTFMAEVDARQRGAPPPSANERGTVINFPGLGAHAEVLTIRDRVQAGAWLQAEDMSQDAPRTYPAQRDPRYPAAPQWLDEVLGDSMNALETGPILEGDLVQMVDAVAISYFPRTGDIVEVERLRFGGRERELTIKQVVVGREGVELWPRSHNPAWQSPLNLTDGMGDGEEAEVRIRGLALVSLRRF